MNEINVIDSTSDLLGIPCMLMRGGTSKGAYFLADDLPSDIAERDKVLLAVMGSPDIRQIDGIGGANPLTSKVAIISKSKTADVDYLFLQVSVDKAMVSTSQNCGNILAGVAPFAIEKGLVDVVGDSTTVRIFMKNTSQLATVVVRTPNKKVQYRGTTLIDGVPTPACGIDICFDDIAGSVCGELLPTKNMCDIIDGIKVTCIDNGMPVVLINAQDLKVSGKESCRSLEENQVLRAKLETIRKKAGRLMQLGDVRDKTVPKMVVISKPNQNGVIHTRTFIPHKCHQAIGVFGAISVATSCLLSGSIANNLSNIISVDQEYFDVEHPSGSTKIFIRKNEQGEIVQSGIVLTARKLFDGRVYIAP